MAFNYDRDFDELDFRQHPELYDIGRHEMKARSARIFEEKWILVREDEDYLRMKDAHRRRRRE